ncbi:MAG: hypothetical protein H7175_07195 [Burkholderiales bacterium]|nr:hypothetical protein [Anaerolineae bacterium]
MRFPIWLAVIAALVTVAAVLVAGQFLLQPNQPLITDAGFTPETITPNADGDSDVTALAYSLSRNADVSLVFAAEDGTTFAFRENERRAKGDYSVLFSGVVDGFTLPDETISGDVVRRLMPDGTYTWTLTAVGVDRDETDTRTGTFVITNGDPELPQLVDFSVSPQNFTPNQDGIDDRAQINLYLTKDANLTVYLLGANDQHIYIAERVEGRLEGEMGRHLFDYEAGVDLGADPPPDGTYTLVAEAEDAEGQRIEQRAELTIRSGGKPLAEIAPQTVGASVVFEMQPYDERYASSAEALGETVAPPADARGLAMTAITMPIGDLLVFKLTVENYSEVPIRTTGPMPGTVYQQEQRAATLGWYDESGAWRIGIDCDTAASDYPWRWAVGAADDLVAEYDEESGNTYYYLPAGSRSVVWGAIRMTELVPARNPQNCWAGLIHEDVEVSIFNARVGPREVELVDPNAALEVE